MVSDKQVQIFLVIIVVFVIIGLLIGRFLTPLSDWIDRFRKTEINVNIEAEKISDPNLKKVYDTVFALCQQGAEKFEYVKMENRQFINPNEIANIIAKAVKACNGQDISIPTSSNPDLKYAEKCNTGNGIHYNCGSDNLCTSDTDRTLLINYNSEGIPTVEDDVRFCDSDAT